MSVCVPWRYVWGNSTRRKLDPLELYGGWQQQQHPATIATHKTSEYNLMKLSPLSCSFGKRRSSTAAAAAGPRAPMGSQLRSYAERVHTRVYLHWLAPPIAIYNTTRDRTSIPTTTVRLLSLAIVSQSVSRQMQPETPRTWRDVYTLIARATFTNLPRRLIAYPSGRSVVVRSISGSRVSSHLAWTALCHTSPFCLCLVIDDCRVERGRRRL